MTTAAALPLAAESLRREAHACGFDVVGWAPASPVDGTELRRYLDEGRAGDMRPWLERSLPARLDPALALPGARSVIVLGIAYGRPAPGPVAGYARGADYHQVHRRALARLVDRLRELSPGLAARAGADAWPLMEKVWAVRCGLGFIGRNGLLVTREHGSWLTLGALIVNREVEPSGQDRRMPANPCGDCTACISACPTGALLGEGRLDARLCLAYQTIEQRGSVPSSLRGALAGKLHGCDECQHACPWNRGVTPRCEPDEGPGAWLARQPDLVEVAQLTRERHAEVAAGTALERSGHDRLRRNALLALAAAPSAPARDAASQLRADASPLVREAAEWLLRHAP